jgi:hypothetical protein
MLLTDPVQPTFLAPPRAAVRLPPGVLRAERSPGRPRNLLAWEGALFRVCPFETRRCDEDRACPPRTVGVAAVLVAGWDASLKQFGPEAAVELSRRAPQTSASVGAARGKVTVCSPNGETRTYQADDHSRSAALCACGNANAAGAALLARHLRRVEITQSLTLPEGRAAVCARVRPVEDGAWRVEQAWGGLRPAVRETRLLGRDVAVCTGAFNDYLIVHVPSRPALESFGLEQALQLWEKARPLGGFDDPLRSRLAAVAPDGMRAGVKFFTCGRAHPGAPLTGLAVLSVVGERVEWLASALLGREVEHPRGTDALPMVATTLQGTEVRLPAVDVVLYGT